MRPDPTVGANCRRGEQTDAIGWLKMGPDVRKWIRRRVRWKEQIRTQTRSQARTQAIYLGSGPSWRGKTPTPACCNYMNTTGSYNGGPTTLWLEEEEELEVEEPSRYVVRL
jgi:hypothetical protein